MKDIGRERRKEPRFPIGAPAQLRRENSNEVFAGTTINVSAGGAFLQMSSPCDFLVGETLICEIFLPQEVDKAFASRGFGRVARIDDTRTAIELTAGAFHCSGFDLDRIGDWDIYFHSLAEAAAAKSRDLSNPVGAVIVSRQNLLLSTGFNGIAGGIEDNCSLLDVRDGRLAWICHAEENAIYHAARMGAALHGAKIYVTRFPCFACCNAIIQVGMAACYTLDSKFWDDDPWDQEDTRTGRKCHDRKRALLRQAGLKIFAPNHEEFGASATDIASPSTSLIDWADTSPTSDQRLRNP